jgi:hypothetical protein
MWGNYVVSDSATRRISLAKDWIAADPMSRQVFKSEGVGPASGIVFRPLYDLHHQRYSVYWPLRVIAPQSSKADR